MVQGWMKEKCIHNFYREIP